ncbi:hypothetical protein FA13DRAFT_1799388 [Coprinellus micaceus]|uniref:Cyanovirin-N domain-containing protein n=1 Tax=Coprinellus micaceus TaxID=71717 RepID=A0A4Y7SJL0_COPMI|nr:hypothetical protein FA13DRAFT_1799388 [Coprinellus micaceus]
MRFYTFALLPVLISPALGGFTLYDRVSSWREPTCDFGHCGTLPMAIGNVHIIRNGVGVCNELLDQGRRIPLDDVDSIVRFGPKTVPSFCNAPGTVTFTSTNGGNNIEVRSAGRLLGTCTRSQSQGTILCYDSTTDLRPCAAMAIGTPQTYCKIGGTPRYNCGSVSLC